MTVALRLKFVGLILTLALLSTSAVKCGDSIATNTVLTANLACDCSKFKSKAALTVVGRTTLDLNGKTVSCTSPSSDFTFCLSIVGNGATIQNGSVKGCNFGVGGSGKVTGAVIKDIIATATSSGIVLSGGKNTLLRLKATNSINAGISIDGKNNKLSYVSANNNKDDGIAVTGDNNTLRHLTAKGNAEFGISTWGNFNRVENSYAGGQLNREGINLAGSFSKAISNTVEDCPKSNCMRGTVAYDNKGGSIFQNNTVRRCGGNGLRVNLNKFTIADNKFFSTSGTSIVASADDVTITGNRITGSGLDGVELTSGRRMVVAGNVIVNSARNGIALKSASVGAIVSSNTVRKCGVVGLQIQGSDNNNVRENTIRFCRAGITADTAADRNSFTTNFVSNSTLFDLTDLSANCGSNKWEGNTGKGNIPCTEK